jgi:hypothetical protein
MQWQIYEYFAHRKCCYRKGLLKVATSQLFPLIFSLNYHMQILCEEINLSHMISEETKSLDFNKEVFHSCGWKQSSTVLFTFVLSVTSGCALSLHVVT